MKKTILLLSFILISVWGTAQDCIDSSLYSAPNAKDTLSLVYLLPLDLDQSIQDGKLSMTKFEQYTKYNYNLYQGALIALDEISSSNADMPYLDVYTVDTKSDTVGLEHWLSKGFGHTDIIFSGLTSENKSVTQKLKSSTIPLVAMTSLSVQTDNYPYYIQVQPTLSSHCLGLKNHIVENYNQETINLITVQSISNVSERAIGYAELDNYPSVSIDDTNFDYELSLKLTAGKTNIIFASLLSTDRATELLAKLKQLKQYNIIVYGMPTWSSIDTHEYTSDQLSVYFSTGFYKHSDTKGAQFISEYKKRYETEPSTYAFKAYESTKYFVSKLIHPEQNLFLSIYNDVTETINDYHYEPVCTSEGDTEYWENKNLYFIKGSDGQLEME